MGFYQENKTQVLLRRRGMDGRKEYSHFVLGRSKTEGVESWEKFSAVHDTYCTSSDDILPWYVPVWDRRSSLSVGRGELKLVFLSGQIVVNLVD